MAAIITAAEARQYVPKLTGTTEDLVILELIDHVDSMFARHLGGPRATATADPTISSTSYTLFYDHPHPDHRDVLNLGIFPVSSITTIHSDVDREYGADTLIAASDYTTDPVLGLVILNTDSVQGTFDFGFRAIRAVFVAGHATVPEDIKAAAKIMLKHIYNLRFRGGVSNVNTAGITATLREELMPPHVKEMLRPYRNKMAEGHAIL